MTKETEVILCPLYGKISTTWKENKKLTKKMTDWPVYEPKETQPTLTRAVEHSYQKMLKSLLMLDGFSIYVGLEINVEHKRFILWNAEVFVEIYSGDKKLCSIKITKVDKRYNSYYHFNRVVDFMKEEYPYAEKVISQWSSEDWLMFFRNNLKEKTLQLSNEINELSNEIREKTELQSLILQNP